MDKFITINTLEEFEKATNQKSIFLFTADWCPDCIYIKPFIGDIVDQNTDFTFFIVNRDNHLDLCKDLDILGIPSFVAYENGQETGRLVNKLRKTRDEIQAFINAVK